MTYAKFAVAILATILSVLGAAMTDGRMDPVEWVNVAIVGVGAAAVFTAPNVPGARYTKAVLAALTAVLTLLVSLISDGLSMSDWFQLGIAALGALGVLVIPNAPPADPSRDYLTGR